MTNATPTFMLFCVTRTWNVYTNSHSHFLTVFILNSISDLNVPMRHPFQSRAGQVTCCWYRLRIPAARRKLIRESNDEMQFLNDRCPSCGKQCWSPLHFTPTSWSPIPPSPNMTMNRSTLTVFIFYWLTQWFHRRRAYKIPNGRTAHKITEEKNIDGLW